MEESGAGPERPRYGIGAIVDHPAFGRGRIINYDRDRYVMVFPGGEVKRVAFSYDGMSPIEPGGDPEMDRVRQAVAEALGDLGWIETDLEMSPRWTGGMMTLTPGKDGTQSKEIPIEGLFKKVIGVREKLRVLEQKINNHPSLSSGEKLELEGYITRCYGSLTTFNVLFSARESQFRGQSDKD